MLFPLVAMDAGDGFRSILGPCIGGGTKNPKKVSGLSFKQFADHTVIIPKRGADVFGDSDDPYVRPETVYRSKAEQDAISLEAAASWGAQVREAQQQQGQQSSETPELESETEEKDLREVDNSFNIHSSSDYSNAANREAMFGEAEQSEEPAPKSPQISTDCLDYSLVNPKHPKITSGDQADARR